MTTALDPQTQRVPAIPIRSWRPDPTAAEFVIYKSSAFSRRSAIGGVESAPAVSAAARATPVYRMLSQISPDPSRS